MALDPHLYPGFLDRSANQYIDNYLPIWEAMSGPTGRLMLLDLIADGAPIFERDYYWTEDVSKVRAVTLNGAIIAGDTTWTLTSGHAAYLQLGDMLHASYLGKTEWVQIDEEPDTTNHQIHVVRGIGDTAGTFDTATEMSIVRARATGSEADEPEFKGIIRRENYSGIISHTVRQDGTSMAGVPQAPYGNELDRQEAEVLTSLKWELEDILYNGPGQQRSASTYGMMKGIRRIIIERAGDNVNAGPVRWGYKLVCDRVNWLHKQGLITPSTRLVCLVPSDGVHLAGLWGASATGRVASDRTFGLETRVIHTTLGLDVPLIWSPAIFPNEFALLDVGRIKKHPFTGRALIRMRKAAGVDLQDYEGRRILMEWGSSVQHADLAHYLQRGVTFAE